MLVRVLVSVDQVAAFIVLAMSIILKEDIFSSQRNENCLLIPKEWLGICWFRTRTRSSGNCWWKRGVSVLLASKQNTIRGVKIREIVYVHIYVYIWTYVKHNSSAGTYW